jgi:hypothetical protein
MPQDITSNHRRRRYARESTPLLDPTLSAFPVSLSLIVPPPSKRLNSYFSQPHRTLSPLTEFKAPPRLRRHILRSSGTSLHFRYSSCDIVWEVLYLQTVGLGRGLGWSCEKNKLENELQYKNGIWEITN